MKIWNWIKTQLDYRQKYKASLQQRLFNKDEDRTAAKNALDVLAKYEILTASLPQDHELSTKIYWKEYADRNLMRDNENLRSQFTHLQKTYYELSNKWTDNILRYGVQMYGKWQPIEIIPTDQFVLVFAQHEGKTKTFVGKLDFHSDGSDVWVFLADDTWEYPSNEQDQSIPIKQIKIVCHATHWMALPEKPQ